MSARLPDLLPIAPFTRPVRGDVVLPGSKSLTNRALILAALCPHPVTLTGALFSEDTEVMVDSLRRLGFAVSADPGAMTIRVEGRGGRVPAESAELFVGLAGTAARFLTALCAAAPKGTYRIDGIPQMRRRPMQGLIDPLRALGAEIHCLESEGHFPLEIRARGLAGGPVTIDASESSQMLSALLMVAPLARSGVDAVLARPVREPFVLMTADLMRRFGAEIAEPGPQHPGAWRVGRASYRYEMTSAKAADAVATAPTAASGGRIFPIEPDATAASYFLALALVTAGSIRIADLRNDSPQGDLRFAEVLRRAGLQFSADAGGFVASYAGNGLHGIEQDFNEFSDTFLTLAAIAPLLDGPTRISGIEHTRRQETDRVASMAAELGRLGQRVLMTEDTLEIHPQPLRRDVTIETYGDHRFAMSFGVLGCHRLGGSDQPWLSIRHPGVCAKTFPNFFELLDTLRRESAAAPAPANGAPGLPA